MSTEPTRAPLRLAIRNEGTWVSAYLAHQDTMLHAEIIGSIRKEALDADRALFDLWRQLMQFAASALIKARTGVDTVWPEPPAPAPEHERGGNA